MRSTFSGLNTMVRGIYSNQLSLDTTGHNITNAGTEGYSRQGVNLSATRSQYQNSLYGEVLVGTGVDSLSIERARDVYADRQYWSESATKKYYESMQVNYDKVETIFNDSDESGIQNALEEFYASWVNLSTDATDSAARVAVVEKGKVLSDTLQTAGTQLKDQIAAEYQDMELNLTKFNGLTEQVANLNKSILLMESSGAKANDLRDQRDLIVDQISEFIDLNVYEDDFGRYTLVSNGITLVNGENQMEIKMSDPSYNSAYAGNDFNLVVADTGIVFLPTNGYFKAKADNIEINKGYIDNIASMAAQLLTSFNAQHRVGVGIDNASTTGLNFFGQNTGPDGYRLNDDSAQPYCNMTVYSWDEEERCLVVTPSYQTETYTTNSDGETVITVGTQLTTAESQIETKQGLEILDLLEVAADFTAIGGENKIAARGGTTITVTGEKSEGASDDSENLALTGSVLTSLNGTRDGSNAVLMSTFFNTTQDNYESSDNAVVFRDSTSGDILSQIYATTVVKGDGFALNSYYSQAMAHLANESEATDTKASEQDDIMTQVESWRSSTAGVDWNEELTNMLMFQKGYSACSRCLTTMDEMLDRLINSTGMVGR